MSMIMKKRGFLVVLILFSIFLIPNVSAQTGCCINVATGVICEDVLQPQCGTGEFHSGVACVTFDSCKDVCNICRNPADVSVTKNVWGPTAAGCLPFTNLVIVGPADPPLTTQATCEATTSQPQTNLPTVIGTVQDIVQDILGPVSGARVDCQGATTLTNNAGGYILSGCLRTTTKIFASKGAQTGSVDIILSDTTKTQFTALLITLGAVVPAKVTVNVKNTAVPVQNIAGVDVTITATGGFIEAKSTDNSGNVVFSSVPLGTVQIVAEKAGFLRNITTLELTADRIVNIVLQPAPTVTLSGVVRDGSATGLLIAGAAITLFHYDAAGTKVVDGTTTSSSTGTYSFTISTGSYFLEAQKNGYSLYSKPLTLTQNTQQDIILQRPFEGTRKLTINVKDADNNPVSSAYVQLYPIVGAAKALYSDDSGKAELILTNALYALRVDHTDYDAYYGGQIDLIEDRTITVTLTAIRRITITGYVKEDSLANLANLPIEKAIVSISGQSSVETDSSGRYSIMARVSANAIHVFVQAANYLSQTALVPPGQQTNIDLPDILLKKSLCNSIDDVGEITLTAAQIKSNISLEWSSLCQAQGFTITRKKGNEEYISLAPTDGVTITYLDSAIEQNTKYCYKVIAEYLIRGLEETRISGEKCVDVGPAICFDGAKTFCDGNLLKECTALGVIDEPKTSCGGTDEICRQQTKTTAMCVSAAKCDLCNRPFGVFSAPATKQGSAFFGGKIYNLTGPHLFCLQSPACFLDYSKTIVEKHYTCSGIESCYDYVSEDACDTKKCTPSEDCEWKPSSSELGIGVCRPRDVQKQDCSAFDNPPDILNKVFATNPGVAKEFCALYSDATKGKGCYYIEPNCLNRAEVSCYNYNDKADCVGPNVGTSGTNNVEKSILVKVTWLPPPPEEPKKAAGDNKIVERSNDYFNIGLCKFFEGSCIRDADNNQEIAEYLRQTPGDDCALGLPDCALDVTLPTTTIDYKEFTKAINFNYTVFDDSIVRNPINKELITTFVAIRQATVTSAYPQFQVTSDRIQGGGAVTDGTWNIFYFSEDASHNLEEVKKITVTVDRKPPKITLSREINPNITAQSVSLITALIADEPIYCTNARLVIFRDGVEFAESPEYPIDKTLHEAGAKIYERYDNIVVGPNGKQAKYVWECYDRAGNLADPSSSDFGLDVDYLIGDPQPSSAVRERINIPISVTTEFSGQCIYTANPALTYAQWTNFSAPVQLESGRWQHSATVNVSALSDTQELRVACRLENVGVIVLGNDPDTIRITIDDKAPTTYPLDALSGFNTPHWINTNAIALSCLDQTQTVPAGFPHESGCGKVFYCIGATCEPTQGGSGIEIVPVTSSLTLRYFSQDNLGNNESIKTQQIKLDTIPPQIVLLQPNVSFLETKDKRIKLIAIINKTGDPANEAPFKRDGTFYKVIGSKVVQKNITIDLEAKQIEIRDDVILEPNRINIFTLHSGDLAGNKEQTAPVTVVQDSLGPNITRAIFKDRSQGIPLDSINFGNDLNLQIEDINDLYPVHGADLEARVGRVWVKDMFGATYRLSKNSAGWNVTIRTSSWFVTTPDFRTFIRVFANDTLGNVAELEKNITLVDITPPTAGIRLENPYGDMINTLHKGLNYVVLTASEGLENVNLFFAINNKNYSVIFTARDFEAITWVGVVNITEDPVGSATADGLLTDLNGLNSSSFFPETIPTDPVGFVEPLPNGQIVAGTYYVNQRLVTYSYAQLQPPHQYQFTVNNKITTVPPSSTILGFNPGLNLVSIREEDAEGNYKLYSQRVFVNISTPAVQKPADVVDAAAPAILLPLNVPPKTNGKPLVVEASVAGEQYALASAIIAIDGAVQGPLSYVNPNLYIFNQNVELTEGSHTLTVTLKDAAGNEVTQTTSITIDKTIADIQKAELIYTDEIQNISGLLTSRKQKISTTGTIPTPPAQAEPLQIYVIGEDQKRYPATGNTLSIPEIKLVGQTFTETLNRLTLVFEDDAGNRAEKKVTVLKDVQPPQLIRLLFTRIIG